MFTIEQLREVYEARKQGDYSLLERQQYDITSIEAGALDALADYDTFDDVSEELLEVLT